MLVSSSTVSRSGLSLLTESSAHRNIGVACPLLKKMKYMIFMTLLFLGLLISQSDAWRRRRTPPPDTTPPEMTCPSVATQYTTTSTATVTWPVPTCDDARSDCTVSHTNGGAPGSMFSEGSHHMITYRAVDTAGNAETCSFGFSVVVIRCNILEVPEQGIVSCTNGRNVGSVCHYSCNSGFSLATGSSSSMTCSLSGTSASWSDSTPSCTNTSPPEITCPYVTTQYTITSTATVTWAQPTCTDDHSSCVITHTEGGAPGSQFTEGFHTITYTTEDTSGNEQRCSFSFSVVVIRCSVMEVPSNAIVGCASGDSVDSVCHFACDPGYDLSGSDTRTCVRSDNTASWSGFETSCTRASCSPTLDKPDNSELQCTNENYFNSICSYTCDPDFRLISGSTHRTCTVAGWSGSTPDCQETEGSSSYLDNVLQYVVPSLIALVCVVLLSVIVAAVVKLKKSRRNQERATVPQGNVNVAYAGGAVAAKMTRDMPPAPSPYVNVTYDGRPETH